MSLWPYIIIVVFYVAALIFIVKWSDHEDQNVCAAWPLVGSPMYEVP